MIAIRLTEVFARLRNSQGRRRIQARIDQLEIGNPGDTRPIGNGVSEMRIHHGPGYPVYFVQRGTTLIIPLAGGEKRTQQRDIATAIKLAGEL